MWFQTLKARHSVRAFTTENSQGLVVGLEYTDKKTEIHALKVRNPLNNTCITSCDYIFPKEIV